MCNIQTGLHILASISLTILLELSICKCILINLPNFQTFLKLLVLFKKFDKYFKQLISLIYPKKTHGQFSTDISKLCLLSNIKTLLFLMSLYTFVKEPPKIALILLHVIMITRSSLTEFINVLNFFHTSNNKRRQ